MASGEQYVGEGSYDELEALNEDGAESYMVAEGIDWYREGKRWREPNRQRRLGL